MFHSVAREWWSKVIIAALFVVTAAVWALASAVNAASASDTIARAIAATNHQSGGAANDAMIAMGASIAAIAIVGVIAAIALVPTRRRRPRAQTH